MSNWHYLECVDHDPVLRSADEVAQYSHALDPIIALIGVRDAITRENAWAYRELGYFERHATVFLVDHPRCSLRLVDEYDRIVKTFPSTKGTP